ncbi:unnamed protein product [Candida verbasci]|uniref:UspA domain-containing protein n=1 Tax=Candida verbasci TaxID=1227364 RepID=A0A9W4U275_9ASCO|nr:unnamed protein product [Candida verbasci]
MVLEKGEAILPPHIKQEKSTEEEEEEEETETQKNTRFNSNLYNQSTESINLYKLENDSSDLLGRLYYDDYDSSTALNSPMASTSTSPMLSPVQDDEFHFTPIQQEARPFTPIQQEARPFIPIQHERPNMPRLKSFERGISFDTTPHGTSKSLTLKVKSPNFKFRRNNKTWLVGYNNDFESQKAIEWLFDEMVINGDTIIILQVLDSRYHTTIEKLKGESNLELFERLNVHNKKVSLIFEIVVGKALKNLKKAISEYNPSMMVIGTHHFKEKERKFMNSSLSKHFLECALVPVIIVKPNYKYIEYLNKPIDKDTYFETWVKKIGELNHDEVVTRHKRSGFLSPNLSRNSSYTNLVQEERGRKNGLELLKVNEPRSRSTSKSRFSRFFKG